MNEQPSRSPEALQILINEHTNLQAMRSATVFEANGRTNLFLGTVSSSSRRAASKVQSLTWDLFCNRIEQYRGSCLYWSNV